MSDPDALRADIEQTRDALGDTVDALVNKADLKGRAQAKVDAQKQAILDKSADAAQRASDLTKAASEKIRETDPDAVAANAVGILRRRWPLVVGVLLGVVALWRLRHRKR